MIPARRPMLVMLLVTLVFTLSACSDEPEEVIDPAFAIRGKRVANRCIACHALERRENKVGPNLVSILGRDVAAVRGFDYSEPMKAHGGVWSRARLMAFLRNPQAVVPGNKMAVSPMNEVEVEALMGYLESLQ